MNTGAFGLVDCLGFKGIWKQVDEQTVMDRLRAIKSEIDDDLKTKKVRGYVFNDSLFDDGSIKWNVSFLSDTVAVGAQWELGPKSDHAEAILVDCVGIALERIIELYISEPPNLTMRGCITYGNFEINGSFIVGPAVDTAAEAMDLSDGAFVWLHRTAEDQFLNWKLVLLNQDPSPFRELPDWNVLDKSEMMSHGIHFFAYDMPFKGSNAVRCYVLNPLTKCPTETERLNVIGKYRESMESSNMAVKIKQQNTLRMLRSAASFTKKYYEFWPK